MNALQAFFVSGRACDVALVCILLEALFLLMQSGKRGALGPQDVFGQLAAGAFLLLAVRCALVGADYRVTAMLLTASFPAHMFDLVRRRQAKRIGTRPKL